MNNVKTSAQSIEALRKRLGEVDMQQVMAWRQMTPVKRLDIAFQAYQFALETVRLTERQQASNIGAEAFAWRVTRRMQGDQKLGREFYNASTAK